MTNLYFVRHWETDRNIKWMMNPWDIDSELNINWINQAINAGKKWKKEWLRFDIIISSPLKRTIKTAKLIAENIWYKWEILTDDRLKEQMWWVLKNYTHKEMKKEFNLKTTEEVRRFFKNKKNNKSEDILEFRDRVSEVYEDTKNKYKGKNILLVWHSWVSRILLFKSRKNLDFEHIVYKEKWIENSKIIKL